MTPEQTRDLAKLESQVHRHMMSVHMIDGRTDQSILDIRLAHPDNEHVKALDQAISERDKFLESIK